MLNRKDFLSILVAFVIHIALAITVYMLAPFADLRAERCDNQKDDDQDGLIDCDDPDCATQPKVARVCRIEVCDNQKDDDQDGLIDCDDPDCGDAPVDKSCLPPEPIVVKVVPPIPEIEPLAPEEPPEVIAEEPEVKEIVAARPEPSETRPPPSGKPPAETPQEEVPLVFGQTFEGGTDGPGLAVPEGNTYAVDPALSAKVDGPVKTYTTGTPGGQGTSPTPPPEKKDPAPKEASAAEVTSSPKQLRCDQSVAKDYPPEARAAGISGKVYVELLIDKNGKIAESKVVQGLGYGLDALALQRVKTCTFSPAKKGDTPVAFRIKRFPVVLLPE